MNGSKTAIGVIAGVVLIAAIGGGAFLYARPEPSTKASASVTPAKSPLARYAVGSLAALNTPAVPIPAPDYVFKTADGTDARFSQFRGHVVVVNLWAMWCAPCRKEMPTLAALETAYQGRGLQVVPINVDIGPDAVADAGQFIATHPPLPFYADPRFQLPFEFPGKGKIPQTILLDRQGHVRATFAGDADWNSSSARALFDAVLKEPA